MIKTYTDAKEWNKHVDHPLQSWEWGEFRQAMSTDVSRISCGQLTFHHIPHTPWCVGYFPKGLKPTKQMIDSLIKLGKQKNAIFIQLEPNISNNSQFTIHNLRRSHHPLFTKYTFVLDLTKSEEELLKSFHSKTRYNIKVSQKHNVQIKEDNSDSAFASYLALTHETTGRQGFYAHNDYYHQTMWNIMHKAGIAHLFTATYNDEVISAWIIFTWKKTIYYPYGASSRNHRETMAPTLLLWEIIRWAKARDITTFDLWGAMGPNPDIHDPWFGFHRFKQGFNPELVEFIGSYDLVLRPLLYQLYCTTNTLRWFFLRIKSKIS